MPIYVQIDHQSFHTPSLKPKTGCHSPETNQAAKITLLFSPCFFDRWTICQGCLKTAKNGTSSLTHTYINEFITIYVFIKLWCIWWWWWGALVGAFQCQDDYCGTIWCPRGSCKTIHSAPELPGYYFFAPMQDQSLCSTSPLHVPWQILIHGCVLKNEFCPEWAHWAHSRNDRWMTICFTAQLFQKGKVQARVAMRLLL